MPLILVAEDDEDDRTMIADLIKEIQGPGIVVIFALNGIELIKFIDDHSNPPAVIFLDIAMPFKTGLECLSAIRQNANYDHVPVIMLSTSMDQKDIDCSFENGANLYIDKRVFFAMKASDLPDLLFNFPMDKKRNRETFVLG